MASLGNNKLIKSKFHRYTRMQTRTYTCCLRPLRKKPTTFITRDFYRKKYSMSYFVSGFWPEVSLQGSFWVSGRYYVCNASSHWPRPYPEWSPCCLAFVEMKWTKQWYKNILVIVSGHSHSVNQPRASWKLGVSPGDSFWRYYPGTLWPMASDKNSFKHLVLQDWLNLLVLDHQNSSSDFNVR